MKNIKFSRLFAAMMFVACLVLTGCKPAKDPTAATIYGKWTYENNNWNTYGDYACNIASDKIETSSYGAHNGAIELVTLTADSGYIYYQFEKDITGYDSSYKPFTVNAKGKWCAVAYKNLTDDSVNMCDAYKTYDFAASLEEAKTLYTVENGWFSALNTTEFKRVK